MYHFNKTLAYCHDTVARWIEAVVGPQTSAPAEQASGAVAHGNPDRRRCTKAPASSAVGVAPEIDLNSTGAP